MEKEEFIKRLENELNSLKKERKKGLKNTTIKEAIDSKYYFKEFLEINDNWTKQILAGLRNQSNY